MNEVELIGLRGRNPLGFLAALGVLTLIDGVNREPNTVSLCWTDSLDPHAILKSGIDPLDLPDRLLAGLHGLRNGSVLGCELRDVKFDPPQKGRPNVPLRSWIQSADSALELELIRALVVEGAVDGGGASKPSHLHFSAGQQQFLDIAREVFDATLGDPPRLGEALFGPWRFDGQAKNFGWAAGTDRIYALRGFNPSSEKRLGVPAADALAFVGLSCLPVWERREQAVTTACAKLWKTSDLTWPLWKFPLSRSVVKASLASEKERPSEAARRGVLEILTAPIKRTDQGGYGSFGAPTSEPTQ